MGQGLVDLDHPVGIGGLAGVAGPAAQANTGTMVSRGMFSTTAPWWPGEMCTTMMVSEQPQPSDPTCRVSCCCRVRPARLSEPNTRMFSALLYFGGRFPRPDTTSWWMPSQISRYLA